MEHIVNAVDKYRELILSAERFLWQHPETGYKEFISSNYMEENFQKLGYDITKADGITGFYTVVDTGRAGPTVLLLAELDAIIVRTHPEADPVTGAVHACGHHAQCATMLGVAAALKDEKVLNDLSGKIMLCVVPAEEGIEMEYRAALREKGVIKYFSGKREFLSRGYFDSVDLAFMVHTGGGDGVYIIHGGQDLGVIRKAVIYHGVAAHAGADAWLGKNALYAANAGLSAVNALRETFRDKDHVRWHPIMTHGGDMVNNIPETARLESMLRASNYEALEWENKKINMALIGAAISFGVGIEINDEPGSAPLFHDKNLAMAAKEAFDRVAPLADIPSEKCSEAFGGVGGGSTDMGDLAMVMPVIHPYIGGAEGKGHGNDYYIVAPETACVTNAKWQVAILKVLLENGGKRAREIKENYHPPFATKEEFFAKQDSLHSSGNRLEYLADGGIRMK